MALSVPNPKIPNPETERYVASHGHPFCPGCGHGLILNALGGALAKLGRPLHDIVVVTDIGCVGLADAHINTHSFHGLHGRSVAYAGGLKLARPELTVIVLMGDGGTGIGAGHILAAARRNIDISVLVFNNFNFGMTGGEHSATTFDGAKTATTPLGNPEQPFDIAGTVALNGASFVARQPSVDRDLHDTIARAILTPGFALMDIWELCTAYFVPANNFTGKMFHDWAERAGLAMGVLKDSRRPSYEAHAYALIEGAPPRQEAQKIPVRFSHNLTCRQGLLLAGAAGGKVKSAAALVAQAGMMSGLQASQEDDYPVTIKTGHSISSLVLDPGPIRYGGVAEPAVVILLAPEGLQRIRKQVESYSEEVRIYADAALSLPPTRAKVIAIDVAGLRKAVGKENIALALAAKALGDSGMFGLEALTAAIGAYMKPQYQEKALQAVTFGAAL
jgi:pyruvate/2-oxoacid:ferredoxin oxidoreductase beta subunit/Pyruvate/2-oxoacid:ferredoxin oxidoreductase gamma subunit